MVEASITTIMPQVTPNDIRGDLHLSDMGADSIDRIEIISVILKKLELNIPLNDFSQLRNIDEMIDLLTKVRS